MKTVRFEHLKRTKCFFFVLFQSTNQRYKEEIQVTLCNVHALSLLFSWIVQSENLCEIGAYEEEYMLFSIFDSFVNLLHLKYALNIFTETNKISTIILEW